MADSFDIVDIIYTAVAGAIPGFPVYKDRSTTGEKEHHIVINTTGINSTDYVNKAPAVNVNVFTKRQSSGMISRSLIKSVVRSIENAVKNNLSVPEGMYWSSKVEWIIPLDEMKEGFDCTNIRLRVITEKN